MRHTLISLIIISLFGFNGASGQNLTDVKGGPLADWALYADSGYAWNPTGGR